MLNIKEIVVKYNGNYWILRLVETGEPKFIVPVSQE